MADNPGEVSPGVPDITEETPMPPHAMTRLRALAAIFTATLLAACASGPKLYSDADPAANFAAKRPETARLLAAKFGPIQKLKNLGSVVTKTPFILWRQHLAH